MYLVPEAFIHVSGIAGVGYGYNVRLTRSGELNFEPKHRFFAFLNIVKKK
ncbi:hypothetical protein [Sporocytophaga myxococcoides]|nr:hypothetical protein [Sporocytophaga myxococcoides]